MRAMRGAVALVVTTALSACNAILGNESNYTLVQKDGGTGGSDCMSSGECADVSIPSSGGKSSSGGASGGGGASNSGGASGESQGGNAGLDASTGTGGLDGSGGDGGQSGIDGGGGADGGAVDHSAVGVLGDPCAPNGSYACAGHAQQRTLGCSKGAWSALTPCTGTNNCDSTPGGNAGSCQPIVAQCAGKKAGTSFCSGPKDRLECGPDLVTTKVVETCPYVCTAGECGGECDPSGATTKQCKGTTNTPQSCDATGTWVDGKACDNLCKDGSCVAASCGDRAKNGDETDIDCGGTCGGCPPMQACKVNGDCALPASGKCTSNKCAAAACNDLVENGSESDVDCGGSCPGCPLTKSCSSNGDCVLPASGKCVGTKCVAAQCNDGVQNGPETDTDCGGTCPANCPVDSHCGQNADCASSACVGGTCTGVCSPGSTQCSTAGAGGVETCGPDGKWGTAVPCNNSQTCSGGVCSACPAGTMDCDGKASNACEKSINTVASCGASCTTVACSAANGIAVCTNGVCGMSRCNAGFGDCGGNNNGCETNLFLDSACGTTCATRGPCEQPYPTCNQGACDCTSGGAVSNGLCCPVGKTGCGTVCVDLQTDNNNCGGCGLACAPGCTSGRCVVTLATGQFSQGIALDATNVYFTNIPNSSVLKVPIGGGPAVTLATGGSAPYSVVVDSTAVYWPSQGAGTLLKVGLGGGMVATLASGQAAPTDVVTDGARIYFTNNSSPNGSVARVPIGGGAVLTLASNQDGPHGLALAGSFVYYTNQGDASGNGAIMRVPTAGGTPLTLQGSLFQPAAIAVDASNIYWAGYGSMGNDSTISKMSISSGAVTALASSQSYSQQGRIAVDGTSVYWANFGSKEIMKVAIGGGTPVKLATNVPNPMSVAVNGQSVFFTSYGGTVGKITPK